MAGRPTKKCCHTTLNKKEYPMSQISLNARYEEYKREFVLCETTQQRNAVAKRFQLRVKFQCFGTIDSFLAELH